MTRRKLHGTTLAYVRWFDSAIYTGGSYSLDDLTGYTENESTGILLESTEDHITIALDRCIDTGNVRLVLCIPKVNVRSIRYFKV